MKRIVLLLFWLALTWPSFSQIPTVAVNRKVVLLECDNMAQLIKEKKKRDSLRFKQCCDLHKGLTLADTIYLSYIGAIDTLLISQLSRRDTVWLLNSGRINDLHKDSIIRLEKDKEQLGDRIRMLEGQLYESRRKRRNQCKVTCVVGGVAAVLATLLFTR